MTEFRSLPGVFDILPDAPKDLWKASFLWQKIETAIRKMARLYGFEEIRTPILERTELFKRSVGETSDIVSKEMYCFEDRGGRNVTMRPEGTAPVVRALLENGLIRDGKTTKVFYIAPMFRYERAQAGRYRQHHQFGVELFGEACKENDVEAIALLVDLYRELGLKNFYVAINALGSENARDRYKASLKNYLEKFKSALSKDSQTRFETNLLRILDSKDAGDRKILEDAPKILDFLEGNEKRHFDGVLKSLETLGIPYQVQEKLVRGLDYYTGIVFEVISDSLGAQNSIGGGGRFDHLVKELGGPDISAVGFGTGLERIIQAMIKENPPLLPGKSDVAIIPLGEKAEGIALTLARDLRNKSIAVNVKWRTKKLQKALRDINEEKALFCIIIGDDEIASNSVQIKQMAAHTSWKVPLEEVVSTLQKQNEIQRTCNIC